ncbi:unnamed protein product, partial [Ectocarpus sp. 8 AP-2014]
CLALARAVWFDGKRGAILRRSVARKNNIPDTRPDYKKQKKRMKLRSRKRPAGCHSAHISRKRASDLESMPGKDIDIDTHMGATENPKIHTYAVAYKHGVNIRLLGRSQRLCDGKGMVSTKHNALGNIELFLSKTPLLFSDLPHTHAIDKIG